MEIYFRILKYLKPYKYILILAIICMVLVTLSSGLSLGMIVPLLDKIFYMENMNSFEAGTGNLQFIDSIPLVQEVKGKVVQIVATYSKMELIRIIAFVVLALLFCKGIFYFLQAYLMGFIGHKVERDIRNSLYAKLQELSIDYFNDRRTGQMMSRITNDVQPIEKAVTKGLGDAFLKSFYVLMYVGIMFCIDWKLALLASIIFPLVSFPINKINRKIKIVTGRYQEKMADLVSILQENISGIRVVKAFSMEKYEVDKFKRENNNMFNVLMKSIKREAVLSPITEMFGAVALLVVLLYGGGQVVKGNIKPSHLILFYGAMASIIQPLKRLSRINMTLHQSIAAGERIFRVLDKQPTVKESEDAIPVESVKKSIQFHNVSFAYGKEDVLKEINLAVAVGKKIAFAGSSGVGKTTLVSLIPRFFDPTKGYISIDGIDIRKFRLDSLRSKIGIVTQEVVLFNDTVKNNIVYGHPEISYEKIVQAAKTARAHDFIMELDSGYHTIIGDRGVKLSGGQKQRISIARAILKNPPILIFDEATSALDSESEKLVQEAIDSLMRNRTAFIIAHRLSTIRNADIIVVLEDGKIAEIGTHDELVEMAGAYSRLHDVQFGEKK